jgi:hypothetical protein
MTKTMQFSEPSRDMKAKGIGIDGGVSKPGGMLESKRLLQYPLCYKSLQKYTFANFVN